MQATGLAADVPPKVKTFWVKMVMEAYQRGLYAQAFEEVFAVLELATVERCRQLGFQPRRFRNAAEWLMKRKVIRPRYNPTLPANCR